ncbi:MAG: UDP-N-acetylmuramate--L-alanine ligase [Zetaproteobacteria bacterium CG12_big_fil_rev_8_21_14_0_65_54_13]|nr:MAG: UDP-N-acetylmuramate--L-alanine ligase [Zetaproteobacteria bacterium CG23_combo_of_CG06-09_8_20_14_all_54_7]PIW44019.1 MAG: UDP-N-acetylmuramate--L-alanine ligase [Zetaproteobacteria bacterium CG12_big_fil_rev_8_21_14_0_65_54_13]PIX54352.1 MAG: UDP-N-acetylmuramate--L-alanine ligase [Zetaproteobacteria bacterium CG_4_10_14_3_um_filter_54_28]PJA28556.1 MAG: UDP-N-acetylmuramate--L-alanine ligase [Zetaproteobacteria bacterium CG_4_9_14_3_um_filter_54_145]
MKARVDHIHLVGIGGIGMSGIAELLHNQGFVVAGSDAAEGPNVVRLRSLGITVTIGHAAENIRNAQVVVLSSAIDAGNPEISAAQQLGIPVIPRAEMLSELMRMKQGVAVAGSHGKTTMTSLIAHGMEAAGMDPTYIIGGRLTATGSNARLGASPWLVAEADESDGSFLRLSPTIAVVSNIDPEHLDHYGDFETLQEAFRSFVNLVPFYGRVVLHHEHPNVAALRADLHKPVTTYGSSLQADLHLLNSEADASGQCFHAASRLAGDLGKFHLAMPGRHNAENALAAMAVLMDLGIDIEIIRSAIASFEGIQRRFQRTSSGEGVMVDDYAHHPREVLATLQAARDCWPDRHISVIFQPHRFTRTRDLMDDFMGAFDTANEVSLLPIYAASEAAIEGVNSQVLCQGMLARGHRQVSLLDDLDAARTAVRAQLAAGNIVMLLGAGSIGALAATLREELA